MPLGRDANPDWPRLDPWGPTSDPQALGSDSSSWTALSSPSPVRWHQRASLSCQCCPTSCTYTGKGVDGTQDWSQEHTQAFVTETYRAALKLRSTDNVSDQLGRRAMLLQLITAVWTRRHGASPHLCDKRCTKPGRDLRMGHRKRHRAPEWRGEEVHDLGRGPCQKCGPRRMEMTK